MPTMEYGDIVVGSNNGGRVHWFDSTGTLKGTLTCAGSSYGQTMGMCFDLLGNLYVTQFSDPQVSKFDVDGNLVTAWGVGDGSRPESIALFENGNELLIGTVDVGSENIYRYTVGGSYVTEYDGAVGSRGCDWICIDDDQDIIHYTSENGGSVYRYRMSTTAQLSALITGLSLSYQVSQRANGEFVVNQWYAPTRYSASGTLLQTYFGGIPTGGQLFGGSLDPDNETYLAVNLTTGMVYRWNLTSGSIVQSFQGNPLGGGYAGENGGGLAVFGLGRIGALPVLGVG